MTVDLDASVRSAAVRAIARGAHIRFALLGSTWRRTVEVDDGQVRIATDETPVPFAVRTTDDVWDELAAPRPRAGRQSLVHLVRQGDVHVDGDADLFWRHVQIVRALLDGERDQDATTAPSRPLAARGSYHRVTTSAGTADLHVERCGSGPALLAFATAGSDIGQWHGIMTDTELTDRYELITVDLPWHGMSSPVFGDAVGTWHLSPGEYTEWIVGIADALELERPVLVGASMAGAAVVHAVARHPGRFAGAVSCQAGLRVANRANARLRATDVNPAVFIPEWTYGLMNPASPPAARTRVWWGYSSGGFGLYAADIDSYLAWDFDDVRSALTAHSPHIAVLSGSYDTTVPPSASRELAAAIPNASFQEMPELGHFPHAENPPVFARYLQDALDRVWAADPRVG